MTDGDLIDLVRATWLETTNRYMIGTIYGNRPVSVYLDGCENQKVWGPGTLYEAEMFVEKRAAAAVIEVIRLQPQKKEEEGGSVPSPLPSQEG